MGIMEFINKDTIKLDKPITKLDKFVFKFINILEKNTDYVIISGYVAILFGRARSTEDIDIFIKRIDKNKFVELYNNLINNDFYCLNSSDVSEIYDYLIKGSAVRFAEKDKIIPNFEIKFPKDLLDEETFDDFIIVITKLGKLKISSLEKQVAFKKYYLKSDKDLEDAEHIEVLFKEHLDKEKIYKYKKLLEELR